MTSDFHIDPPSPTSMVRSPYPAPPPVIRVKNKHKERSAIVVATKTKARPPEVELPHQWAWDRLQNMEAYPDPPLRRDRPEIPESKEGTEAHLGHGCKTTAVLGDSCGTTTSLDNLPESAAGIHEEIQHGFQERG